MNPDEQKQIASMACQMFDRLDFKGGELQAVMQVRGMLEGLASGGLQLVQVQPPQPRAVDTEAEAG